MKSPKSFMKSVLLFITVLMISCSSLTDTEEKTDHSDQTVYFSKLTEDGAEIVLQNVNHEQLSFAGYSKDSPLKNIEVLKNGKWELLYLDWCGTGAENHTLKHMESIRFVLNLPAQKEKLRVGISVKFDNSENYEQVWSDEFSVN